MCNSLGGWVRKVVGGGKMRSMRPVEDIVIRRGERKVKSKRGKDAEILRQALKIFGEKQPERKHNADH